LTDSVNAIVLPTSTEFSQYVGDRSSQTSFSAYGALVNDAINWDGPTPILTRGSGGNEFAVPELTAFTIVASVTGDPHVRGANGIAIEFSGKASANYTLLAAPGFEITMQMAAHGPSEHFISSVGLLFRSAAVVIAPHALANARTKAALARELAAVGAKVVFHGASSMSVELCRGHTVAVGVHHTTQGKLMNFLGVQVSVPGCHNAYAGVLGQTYQCRWATETFRWSRAMEETFRVATLTTPTGAFSAAGAVRGSVGVRW
jgi:hypothetical protein